MTFILDPRIQQDSLHLGTLPLCQVRLQNNALFPWLILVPEYLEAREIIDLLPASQQHLWQEIGAASHILRELYQPEKLNIAALGNIVSQLHIHVIARFLSDSAWPQPVWGNGHQPYGADALSTTVGRLKKAFAKIEGFVPVEG